MEERENQSNLYITPEDRIEKVEETSESNVTEEVIKDTIHLESGKKDENRIEENKKIRRVLLFFFLMLINVAFFSYIIYLIIKIFTSL
ncbi:MAG: hypothetical protein PUC70_02460 [bacterium]|nr:hypothetical protein [bacterium]